MAHTLQRMQGGGRQYDNIYDPSYHCSGQKDHAKSTFRANTGPERVQQLPVYQTMFSELRHHPRSQFRLKNFDPVPPHVSRAWPGQMDAIREQARVHQLFTGRSVALPPQQFPNTDVGGKERAMFFRRPIIPFTQQLYTPYVMDTTKAGDSLVTPGGRAHSEGTILLREIGETQVAATQTDYRESEAQTDPYSAEFVVRPGAEPELLSLAALNWNAGLPAGLAEVEMVERAREKRRLEAAMPPLSDVTQLARRRKMMDDLELREWSWREKEIERLQAARLQVLLRLLKEREENHQELASRRLGKLWTQRQQAKRKRGDKSRANYLRAVRTLMEKYTPHKVEGKLERRDVVADYKEHESQPFAPLTRLGIFPDKLADKFVVKSRYLSTYAGLCELEASLPDFVTKPRVVAPRSKTTTKQGFVKRAHREALMLDAVYVQLKQVQEEKVERPLRFLQRVEKPRPRPATPSVEEPSLQGEETELALVTLQKLLRGRAAQGTVWAETARRAELIAELRATHALQEEGADRVYFEREATIGEQKGRAEAATEDEFNTQLMQDAAGASLGHCAEFLTKELVRLQEERRIHAFAMLADRERRLREAEESGRRQFEERRRREEDEVFKQTLKVKQESVDLYLEDIVLKSVNRAASATARAEVRKLALEVDAAAYDAAGKSDALQGEEIVSELVHGWLLPHINREDLQQRAAMVQRAHLMAAHQAIHGVSLPKVESEPLRYETEKNTRYHAGSPLETVRLSSAAEEADLPVAAETPVDMLSPTPDEADMMSPTPDEADMVTTEGTDQRTTIEDQDTSQMATNTTGELINGDAL